MPVKLNSGGGGSVTLDVPTTGSTFTATFPANTGTVVTTGSSAAVTPTMLSQPLTLMTAQNSTSGTFIDFTGIPSWARRITVIFNAVSTNGGSNVIVQLGSGSLITTGYASQGSNGNTGTGVITTGLIALYTSVGTTIMSGHLVLTLVSSNTWVSSGSHAYTHGTGACSVMGGFSPNFSGSVDRLRITTVNGTDAFDAGSVNVMYEG